MIQGLTILAAGLILTFISPKFAGIVGFAFGYLFLYQLEGLRSRSNSVGMGPKSIVYALVFSACVLMFVPRLSLGYLVLITGIVIPSLMLLMGKAKFPESEPMNRSGNKLKGGYVKGIFMAFLLYFLLSLTLYSDRIFFDVLCCSEQILGSVLIPVIILSSYLGSILFLEFTGQKNIKLPRWGIILIVVAGILLNLWVPLLFPGPISVILCVTPNILGFLLLTTRYFERIALQISPADPARNPYHFRGGGSFVTQWVTWFILGFVLLIIPPSFIVVDWQGLFASAGFPALQALSWSPQWWVAFYNPPVYTYLTIPLNVGLVIYAILLKIS